MAHAEIKSEIVDFKDFLASLQSNNTIAWKNLDFVLKRILYKWMSRKGIHPDNCKEIYSGTMEVFIKKFHSIYFNDFTSLKSYVFSIADNKVKEYYRSERKHNILNTDNQVQENYLDALSEEDIEYKEQSIQNIYSLFKELTDTEQIVLDLIYKQEKSFEDVAQILKINPGNLRVIKHRAIEKLRKKYFIINGK